MKAAVLTHYDKNYLNPFLRYLFSKSLDIHPAETKIKKSHALYE